MDLHKENQEKEKSTDDYNLKGLKEMLMMEMKNFGNTTDEDWKLITKHRNIKVYQNVKEDIFTFKGEMIFHNVDGKTIFNLICDTKLRKQWDHGYLKEEVLEIISEKEDIIYIQIKTPKGITNRDNCLYRFKENINDQQFFILSKSVERKKKDDNFVRATTYYHNYYIETLSDNTTKLFILSKQGIDPFYWINFSRIW
eukprot:gene6121-10130_t